MSLQKPWGHDLMCVHVAYVRICMLWSAQGFMLLLLLQASFVGAIAITDLVKSTLGPKGMVGIAPQRRLHRQQKDSIRHSTQAAARLCTGSLQLVPAGRSGIPASGSGLSAELLLHRSCCSTTAWVLQMFCPAGSNVHSDDHQHGAAFAGRVITQSGSCGPAGGMTMFRQRLCSSCMCRQPARSACVCVCPLCRTRSCRACMHEVEIRSSCSGLTSCMC